MSDTVQIRHPGLPKSDPATTTREAYEQLWKGKGFEIVQPADSPVAATDLKGAALDQALTDAGLSTSGTADEKRARLAEHQSQES